MPLNTSPAIKPLYEIDKTSSVAVVLASYVLFDAVMPETVKALAVTSAVEV